MDTLKKKHKILLIDDDIFFRKLCRDQLIKAGFDFLEATTGVEGLHKIETDNPDLILLDLMLPVKSGFELLKKIKSDSATKNIPVIIISNLSQESDIKEGMSLGAHDYLVKGETRLSEVAEMIKEKFFKNSNA